MKKFGKYVRVKDMFLKLKWRKKGEKNISFNNID